MPDVIVHHPATHPSHAAFYRLNARNRVWFARPRRARLLIRVNLAVWAAVTLARTRERKLFGVIEGVRGACGTRKPMRWNTVARRTRAGRPLPF